MKSDQSEYRIHAITMATSYVIIITGAWCNCLCRAGAWVLVFVGSATAVSFLFRYLIRRLFQLLQGCPSLLLERSHGHVSVRGSSGLRRCDRDRRERHLPILPRVALTSRTAAPPFPLFPVLPPLSLWFLPSKLCLQHGLTPAKRLPLWSHLHQIHLGRASEN